MIALVHPMDQGPSDPSDAPAPADPATLAEAIEEARAEREEQGRVVLERVRALREAYERMSTIPTPTADEHLTEAGEERIVERTRRTLAAGAALTRLLEADEDLATAERSFARLEGEQSAPPLGEEAYALARAAGLADRDDARGGMATMRRAGQ